MTLSLDRVFKNDVVFPMTPRDRLLALLLDVLFEEL
jgi:hypothetical protein